MSANVTSIQPTPGKVGYITYKFSMGKPVPQYLISLMSGNLARESLGESTYIISEPGNITNYAREFDRMQSYIENIESYL